MSVRVAPREVSVVVQGRVDARETPACLESLAVHLPGAEVILSTWDREDTTGLPCDKVVYSRDPGSVSADRLDERFNNLNRELVGVQAGLDACSRPYALKIRSDMVLTGAGFAEFAGRNGAASPWRVFEHPIVTISLFTRRFVGSGTERYHTPFHVSDWVHFGLTGDVTSLWAAPLVDEPGFSRHFEGDDRRLSYAYGTRTWRFPPEQYLFYTRVRRTNPAIHMDHLLDYDARLLGLAEKYVDSNFVVLSPSAFGVMLHKEPYRTCCVNPASMPPGDYEGLYPFRQ